MTSPTKQLARKVPEITALFWAIKLLSTAMGESTSDFFATTISPYLAVGLGFIVFIIALTLQFRTQQYVAKIYWFAVTMVAVFGTMVADVIHKQLGIPYIASTIFFTVALVVIFALWQRSEKTLSVHSITTRKREVFYWATVLATFALGTATGDLTANTLGLGYLSSGILFGVVILAPALFYYRFGLNEILAFWLTYILTRPLGASFADWLGKPAAANGLGLGDGPVSLVLTLLIIGLVIYASRKQNSTRLL